MNIIKGSDMLRNIPVLSEALYEISKTWAGLGAVWLLGGSCSLLLQQIELERLPNDIDVYADIAAAKRLHTAPPGVSEDRQELNRCDLYISLLSHYRVGGQRLELVGGFEITAQGSMYRLEVEHVLKEHAPLMALNDIQLYLTPLSHELMFNMLRDRPDRYEAIAQAMNARPELHAPLMGRLLQTNVWSDRHLSRLTTLLPWTERLIFGQPKHDKGGKCNES